MLCLGTLLYLRTRTPAIPSNLAADIPGECTQVILVLSPAKQSVNAGLWMLERSDAGSPWHRIGGPVPVSLGRSGLAWGDGEHRSAATHGMSEKREGDGCSPAGVFRIPFAFGYAAPAEAGVPRMPYTMVTPTLSGVDDSASRFYNQVVDASAVTKDWTSDETMLRPDGLYRHGAFVAHNPANTPGRGSCIFLHIWRGQGTPTSGCTAMAEASLQQLLAWLDAARSPRLVQTVGTPGDS